MDSRQRAYDPHERLQREVDDINREEGNLNAEDGIDCRLCKNRGRYATIQKNTNFGTESLAIAYCSCMAARRSWHLMERSGLKNLMGRYTLDQFEAKTPWQQVMKQKAVDYIDGRGSQWFFAGGQVGCGKSHICTAICIELMKRGEGCRYMLWKDVSTRLKALVNDEEAYTDEMTKLKFTPVLYIDDLFKTQRRPGVPSAPTPADVNLAFEIINARYMDKTKKTVISCEWMIDDLLEFDEGVASRICEMSRASCVEIGRDPKKNYRMMR